MSGRRRPRRGVWLCLTCHRCRRYTCLQTLWHRMWCAYCQAVTVWGLTEARPRMNRNLDLFWQGPGLDAWQPEEDTP